MGTASGGQSFEKGWTLNFAKCPQSGHFGQDFLLYIVL